MPSPWIKQLSRETDKSEKELEKLWDKAKKITSEEFGKDEDDFGNKEYKYVTGVVKKMLGIDESILDPSHFLDSEMSAKQYLETVVSGNFSIGNVQPPEDDEKEEEEDYDEEECNEETGEGCGDGYEESSPTKKWTEDELAQIAQENMQEKTDEDEVAEDLVRQLDAIIEED